MKNTLDYFSPDCIDIVALTGTLICNSPLITEPGDGGLEGTIDEDWVY